MSRIIDHGLEQQIVLLTRMGELSYETLVLSIRGYLEGRSVQERVEEMSSFLVVMADKVEDETFELIARFQPVASDLRAIKSYMKIANDFARYGRYALDISSINEQLGGLKHCDEATRDYLANVSENVLFMVKTSVDSLRKHDVALAKTISPTEREVDQKYLEFLNKISCQEQSGSKGIISNVLFIRYLERIADHATYVCESIIYIVTGEKLSLG